MSPPHTTCHAHNHPSIFHSEHLVENLSGKESFVFLTMCHQCGDRQRKKDEMLHCGHLCLHLFLSVYTLCERLSRAASLALTSARTPATSNPITSKPGSSTVFTTFQLLYARHYNSSVSTSFSNMLFVILSCSDFNFESFIGGLFCFS